MKIFFFAMLCLTTLAAAHFRIPFPGERNATNWATQLEGPCGGSNSVIMPRFKWNPSGSPINIDMHHNASVGAIYLCPHETCKSQEDFNVLVKSPFDMAGAGNFCIPSLVLPDEFNEEGLNGTVQVIYAGTTTNYSAYDYMYNCVDITVSTNGPIFNGSQCSNTSGVSVLFDSGIDSNFSSQEKTLSSETKVPTLQDITPITVLNEFYNETKTSSNFPSTMAGMPGMSGMSSRSSTSGAVSQSLEGLSTTTFSEARQSSASSSRTPTSYSNIGMPLSFGGSIFSLIWSSAVFLLA